MANQSKEHAPQKSRSYPGNLTERDFSSLNKVHWYRFWPNGVLFFTISTALVLGGMGLFYPANVAPPPSPTPQMVTPTATATSTTTPTSEILPSPTVSPTVTITETATITFTPAVVDIDGDGVSDADETVLGTDPLASNLRITADSDKLVIYSLSPTGISDQLGKLLVKNVQVFFLKQEKESGVASARVLLSGLTMLDDCPVGEKVSLPKDTLLIDKIGASIINLSIPFEGRAVAKEGDYCSLQLEVFIDSAQLNLPEPAEGSATVTATATPTFTRQSPLTETYTQQPTETGTLTPKP